MIGNLIFRNLIFTFALLGASAQAQDFKFAARADNATIAQDESVAIKIILESNSQGVPRFEPRMQAPDFEEVNSYESQASNMEMDASTGSVKLRASRVITKVLRPKKTGTLKITGIRTVIGGKTYRAKPIQVQVVTAGQGTPPPRGYGGGSTLGRGAKKNTGKLFFLKAEVNKGRVYKGEQVVVSYYLYRRASTFGHEVKKFPVLEGFLREDLEIPALRQRLPSESVVFDGATYERALLVRYAAYPLKKGKLRIDPIDLGFNYYPQHRNKDPFGLDDPFKRFFQQISPKRTRKQSPPIYVEVLPLPAEGRPANFSGAVGDFEIQSAVDRYELDAHDAATLTVQIEGRGNVSTIKNLNIDWPPSVDLFESSDRSKSGKRGVGEKTFEYLFIPRQQGKLQIPEVKFSYFDPKQKKYVTKKSAPFEMTVRPGDPAKAANIAKRKAPSQVASTPDTKPVEDIRHIRPPGERPEGIPIEGTHWGRYAIAVALGLLMFFGIFVFVDQARKSQVRRNEARMKRQNGVDWRDLKGSVSKAKSKPVAEVSRVYEAINSRLLDVVESRYSVGAKSFSRVELKEKLADRGMNDEVWGELEAILERGEMWSYAGAASTNEKQMRSQLPEFFDKAREFAQKLDQKDA